jgi:hypothetical protein
LKGCRHGYRKINTPLPKQKPKRIICSQQSLYAAVAARFMVGESGRGKLGMTYYYYKCISAKKNRGCDKKAVKKDWIERAVVHDTVNFVLQDKEIERIAKELITKQG